MKNRKFLVVAGSSLPQQLCKSLLVLIGLVLGNLHATSQHTMLIKDHPNNIYFVSTSQFFVNDFLANRPTGEFNFSLMRPSACYPSYTITGLFCKMEHRIEATSNFAPRFRLGSVNYTDWMEGKKPFLSRYAK